MTIRFGPTAAVTYGGSVDFTSNGGSASRPVTGTGVSPSITVSSPAAGVVWVNGTSQSITWTSSGVTGNVKIQLSRDGGVKWTERLRDEPELHDQVGPPRRSNATSAGDVHPALVGAIRLGARLGRSPTRPWTLDIDRSQVIIEAAIRTVAGGDDREP